MPTPTHLKSDLIARRARCCAAAGAELASGDPLDEFQAAGRRAGPSWSRSKRKFLIDQIGRAARQACGARPAATRKSRPSATPVSATIAKLEATLPVLQERLDIAKTLYDKRPARRPIIWNDCRTCVERAARTLMVQKSRAQRGQCRGRRHRPSRAPRAVAEFRRTALRAISPRPSARRRVSCRI